MLHADEAAGVAGLVVVGADAGGDLIVAGDPGAPADVLAGLAGDRHRFLRLRPDEKNLVAARPDLVAVVAEQLQRHALLPLVPDEDRHVGGESRGGKQKSGEQDANHGEVPRCAIEHGWGSGATSPSPHAGPLRVKVSTKATELVSEETRRWRFLT